MFERLESNVMHKHFYFLLLIVASLSSCSTAQHAVRSKSDFDVQLDTLRVFDEVRQREIPIAIYKSITNEAHQKMVVFSHGYGANYQKNYLVYSYITRFLASKGYYVISIQHELPTDSLLPTSGIPQVVRLPMWERGVDNIFFVISELIKTQPTLDFHDITLIGHSNGGDISVLFPQYYPDIVDKIITLDHLRVTLPKQYELGVYSLRSSDKIADEGVLLTEDERNEYGIIIERLKNVKHNDMNDFGKRKSKKLIQQFILEFLN